MVNISTKAALQTLPSFTAPKVAKREEPLLSFSPEEASQEENLSVSNELPPLKLVGTIIGVQPFAVIFDPALNKQEIYRIKDDIGNGWLIHLIDKNRVTLRKGTNEALLEVRFIESDQKTATGKELKPDSAGGGLKLDSRDVEGALADMNKIMTQARAVPNLVEGKTKGYRIFNIAPGSIYTKLGIQNNDIVERVNGVEINSPDTLYQLFQQIKSERKIALDFNRGGRKESVNIEIR